MISVGSQARFATPFKSFFLTKIAAPIGLAAFLCWAAPGTAMSQPVSPAVSPGPATCRTPAVEARIQELRKEVADREQDDEGARKVVTSYTLKGASPNPVYKRYYDFLQESLRLRQELAQLEGLPPCPQPVAATPITSAGQYNSPFNDRSGYTGYRPFYYTPGYTPAPPAYNTPGYTSYPSYYNSPFYNAPVAPPPPVIGYSPFYNAPVYNAPWEGGGFYFGPTGSASFLQDSDLIKRIEPRTTDSLWSMPRSITGTSTNWASSSGSLRSGSDSWRGLSEGGSKTRVLSSSTGYNVGARAGYQFGNVRVEGEFDYANNSADTLENPRREISTDLFRRDDSLRGSTTGMTFLGNMIYDFNVPGLSGYGVTPHVLGGIGAGRISTDLKWGDRTIVNSSDWNFAYQLGAGVRYQVMPNWSLDLDYRYRGIIDTTLRNDFEKITVPYRSHNFVASLTWQLPPLWGVVAPATPYMPPPPPPPPPSRPGLPVM